MKKISLLLGIFIVGVVRIGGLTISILRIHISLELVSEGLVGVMPNVHLR